MEKIKNIISLIMAAGLLLLCSCVNDRQYSQKDNEQASDSTLVEVTLSSYTTVKTSIREASGLCFNKSRDGFYAVSDENGLYEISLTGSTVREIWTSSSWGTEDHDFEAVALDETGERLFVLDESESNVYLLTGSNWENRTLFAHIDAGTTQADYGPEGMCYARGYLYITNQASPARICRLNVSTKELSTLADVSFNERFLSDVCFDTTDGTLWIVDSKAGAFYNCKADGTLICKYNLGFSIVQAEGIVIDRTLGCVYLASDEKPTSPIYKISLNK